MTQGELDKLLARVIAQARAVKIPVSDRICPQVRLNRRAKTRFGCCVRKDGAYAVELSARLAGEGTEDAILRVLARRFSLTWGQMRSDTGILTARAWAVTRASSLSSSACVMVFLPTIPPDVKKIKNCL